MCKTFTNKHSSSSGAISWLAMGGAAETHGLNKIIKRLPPARDDSHGTRVDAGVCERNFLKTT